MMYCRGCNNTHWAKAQVRHLLDRVAPLALKRPYQCTKCDRIQLGSVFLDFRSSEARKPTRKTAHEEAKGGLQVKCPECGGSVHRCPRRKVERLFVFTKAYRCFKCEARFWKFTPV